MDRAEFVERCDAVAAYAKEMFPEGEAVFVKIVHVNPAFLTDGWRVFERRVKERWRAKGIVLDTQAGAFLLNELWLAYAAGLCDGSFIAGDFANGE